MFSIVSINENCKYFIYLFFLFQFNFTLSVLETADNLYSINSTIRARIHKTFLVFLEPNIQRPATLKIILSYTPQKCIRIIKLAWFHKDSFFINISSLFDNLTEQTDPVLTAC